MKKFSPYIAVGGLLVFFSILPLMLPDHYTMVLTLVFIFAIFAMSLEILLGHTGLPSLGHSSFFGSSAYMVGILNAKVFDGGNFGIELAAGLAFAAIVSAVFGLLALRCRADYFLMVTLALSMTLWGIAIKWHALTGGDEGLVGISRPSLGPIPLDISAINDFYYFVLFFFCIAAIVIYFITKSPLGHILLGIRENETRMTVLGYNTWLYKYISFILAGTFAGLAGILYVYYDIFVSPSTLHLHTSAEVLMMVILGGEGTLVGPVVGAFIITFLKYIASGLTEHWLLILGIIYVLVIVFTPHGIYPPVKRFVVRRLQLWKRW